MKINSYPQIYNLGHSELESLFEDVVLITEKVDGSQFSFSLSDGGELHCRSKGKDQSPDQVDKMFVRGVEAIQNLPLHPNWVYRGEYLEKPKHNALAYSRIPNNHIILFDIQVGMEKYLPYDEVYKEAQRIGLEVVPILTSGIISDWETLKQFLEYESVLGGAKIEGMVIKNYYRFGRDKKVLMGKYVSEAFKEVHGKEWKKNNPNSKDVVTNLIEMYRTDARWDKAIQHLRDSGDLTNSPKDIGVLLTEINTDILKEEEENIKKELWKWAWPRISRGTIAGFPEYYKNKLAEQQFSKE